MNKNLEFDLKDLLKKHSTKSAIIREIQKKYKNPPSSRTLYRKLKELEEPTDLIPKGMVVEEIKKWTTPSGKIGSSVTIKKNKDSLKSIYPDIAKYFSKEKPISLPCTDTNTGIAKVVTSDWHIGAYIRNLVRTQNFDTDILKVYLEKAAGIINNYRFNEVHITIAGDFIESFSGLNHSGTFKELELWGKDSVIAAYQMITWWLSIISNVKSVTLIAGNHDRSQPSKELEYEGDIAGILSFFLAEKLDCTVNYHPFIFKEVIDNICYINTHGDKRFMANPSNIVWNYGEQSMYNLILAGHKHTRQRKDQLITKEVFSTLNDSNSFRVMYCPSLFTGNYYSETAGFTSDAGFYIITNFYNKPLVLDIPLSKDLIK